MMLRIIHETGTRKGTQTELGDLDVVRLGRHPSNDYAFNAKTDLGVSGFHAEIHVIGAPPVIRDLKSRNGLYVNGHKVAESNLAAGDLVELGHGGPAFRIEYANKSYGEKTVGMMIQQALARAGFKGSLKSTKYFEALVENTVQKTTSRQKKIIALLFAVLVALGLGAAYYAFQHQPGKVALQPSSFSVERSPDQAIASANRFAIFMLSGRLINEAGAPGDFRGFCTAFAISSNLLATAAHCVKSAQTKYAEVMVVMNGKPSNQQTITGMLIHQDYKIDRLSPDVGLLRIEGHIENIVKTADEDALFRLAPGAPMFLYGFPGRLNRVDAPEATFVKGNIGRITTFDLELGSTRENTLIQHSAFSSTGTSGSPLFNEAGQAIGINSGGYTENGEMLTGYNFGVRIDMIRVLISKMETR
jgi:S1-C subfamily serine protease